MPGRDVALVVARGIPDLRHCARSISLGSDPVELLRLRVLDVCSLLDCAPLHPNERVHHATAAWAVREGKARFALGGAHTPDDGFLRHKRLFAPACEVPFRTCCLMHDEVARRRAAASAVRTPWTPEPGHPPLQRP